MLKRIVFENFVHFSEKNIIDFTSSENNAALNIFVGANHSGKSTVCELIRRCMTNEINVTQTRPFNKDYVAYAFCDFRLDAKEEVICISGMIKEPDEKDAYKIFWFKDKSGIYLRLKCSGKNEFTKKNPFEDIEQKFDISIFDKKEKVELFLKKISKLIKIGEPSDEGVPEKPDWKDIEERYVATFPLRGIGMVQWTKSDRIKEDHYAEACKRAEIISTLLDSKDIDKTKEKEMFDYITYPHVFEFKKKGEEIMVSRADDKTECFPLLKTSEGVLEAKATSLLLALNNIQTLCLEEPDKSMHPQMAERLKTLLYLESLKKTIVVVTHSPYFVDTTTIKNTHVFFRSKKDTTSFSCSVTNAGKNKDLYPVADIETMRTLLFATKVLTVEGPTDREVVQALFTFIKTQGIANDISYEMDMKDKLPACDQLDFTTYQIILLGSCENAKKVRSFCKFIHLPCLCLLDLDKFVSVKKEDNTIENFKSIPDKQYEEKLTDDFTTKHISSFFSNGFDEFSKFLKTEMDTFVWKGTLEEAILSSDEHENAIAKALGLTFTSENPKKRAEQLKGKLKKRLTDEERQKMCTQLLKVPEIQRFLQFMKEQH